jgi:hypothetical protein
VQTQPFHFSPVGRSLLEGGGIAGKSACGFRFAILSDAAGWGECEGYKHGAVRIGGYGGVFAGDKRASNDCAPLLPSVKLGWMTILVVGKEAMTNHASSCQLR